MTLAITIVHVIAALVLILFILLHAGRGGGLSEMFGGAASGGGSSIAERNLDRLTVIAAVVFAGTTVALFFRLRP